jgi:hypothetical protein
MSQKNSTKIDEKLILDWGTRIALAASSEALLATAAFALRQGVRLNAKSTGRVVANALLDLYSKGGTKDDARKMLGIAKWVYEASEYFKAGKVDYNTITLEDYLRQATRGGR